MRREAGLQLNSPAQSKSQAPSWNWYCRKDRGKDVIDSEIYRLSKKAQANFARAREQPRKTMPTYQRTLETAPTSSGKWSSQTSHTTRAGVSYIRLTPKQLGAQTIAAFIEPDRVLKPFVMVTEGYPQKTAYFLASRPQWQDVEYREAYAEAAVEQGIAWQVRINRERRGLTQSDLAARIETQQSAVSRMEDPEYGAHSLQQLVKVAHAFDCALLVKFVSYTVLARESECLSPDQLFAPSYTEETGAAL